MSEIVGLFFVGLGAWLTAPMASSYGSSLLSARAAREAMEARNEINRWNATTREK